MFDSRSISCLHACRTAQPFISDEYEAADGDAFGTLNQFSKSINERRNEKLRNEILR